MSTSVAIDEVETSDQAPTVAPHRISDKAGKDEADVRVIPTTDAAKVKAVRFFEGGTDHNTGDLLRLHGVICGSFHTAKATGLTCSDYEIDSTTPVEETLEFDDFGAPDRDAEVNVYAMGTGGDWSDD